MEHMEPVEVERVGGEAEGGAATRLTGKGGRQAP